MLFSTNFRGFCTSTFITGSIVTNLTDVSTFFKRRHQIVLDAVISPMRLKSSPLVRPGLFTAPRLIRNREHWGNNPRVAPVCLHFNRILQFLHSTRHHSVKHSLNSNLKFLDKMEDCHHVNNSLHVYLYGDIFAQKFIF